MFAVAFSVAFITALGLLYPIKYEKEICTAALRYELEPALVMAVARTESGFKRDAVSKRGAMGIMQLMPETASWMAESEGIYELELDEPELNIRLGAAYLKYLLRRFGDERWALAAYNAGEGNAAKWRKEGRDIAFYETREYIKRVTSAQEVYRIKLKKHVA